MGKLIYPDGWCGCSIEGVCKEFPTWSKEYGWDKFMENYYHSGLTRAGNFNSGITYTNDLREKHYLTFVSECKSLKVIYEQ